MKALAVIAQAIGAGAHRASQIVEATGIPLATVYARLGDLRNLGTVKTYRMRPDGRRGSPEKHHRLNVWSGQP